jgi:hypothetical protein
MPDMRLRLSLLAALLAAMAAVPSPARAEDGEAPSATQARCGTVTYGGRTYVMSHVRISCPSARRKIRYVNRYKRLPGWRCESGTNFRTGGGCTRGRKYFGWHPAD